MDSGLSFKEYISLNSGRYFRDAVRLPGINCTVYLTVHPEIAETDLVHHHDHAHLSLVLKGGVIDRRRTSEQERISGDLMFFRAGETHQSIYRGFPVTNINVELESDFFRGNHIDEDTLHDSLVRSPSAKLSLLKVFREMSRRDEFSSASMELLMLGLIGGNNAVSAHRPSWLTKVVDLLHDNWDGECSLADLASVAGVHPKTISKYFPRYLNCTLGEYRRRIKIDKSLSMIKSSGASLTEIAHVCGFYDQSHFTSVFKELTGFRPNQFRRF